MIRRIAIAAALAIGVTAGIGAGSASAQEPVGPECRAEVSRVVLAAVQGRVAPGQVIQYLQVTLKNGRYVLESCVVTVPA